MAVMRCAGDTAHGRRTRGLIVLLWRAELRVSEARSPRSRATWTPCPVPYFVRQGKGGKRREVGMDRRAWHQINPWLERRLELPVGALLCVTDGPTRGRPWSLSAGGATLSQRRCRASRKRETVRGRRVRALLPVVQLG